MQQPREARRGSGSTDQQAEATDFRPSLAHARSSNTALWKKAAHAATWAGKVDPSSLTFDALFKKYEFKKAFSLDSQQVLRDAERVKKRLHDNNRWLL